MRNKTYIIAEAGVNHNGSMEIAEKLIVAAADAGADAVKFQTFKAENLASRKAQKAEYQTKTTAAKESQIDMLKKLELPLEEYPRLLKLCKECSIDFLSSPFDIESLKFLSESCKVPLIKIPSGEITNLPFLLETARTKKPVILSSGMSTLGEIETALSVLSFGYLREGKPKTKSDFLSAYIEAQQSGLLREKVRLLHCTTEYPAPFEEVNLAAMDTLRQVFALPVGYSDHTEGTAVALAAVARGAVVIEKHITLDKNMPGPDHKSSLEPHELKSMTQGIRQIEKAVGNGLKIPSSRELNNLPVVRKSITARVRINKGEIFTEENLSVKRPAGGLEPAEYWNVLGQRARRDFNADEWIDFNE